ncbi:MAG: acyltransferase [Eubacterium sp.]|nr:acyltransferase [Eubacterium sp.]
MWFGKIHNIISTKSYLKKYVKHLKNLGVNIYGFPNYISPDAYFDSHFYSSISIGKGVVISKQVLLLTHDYSIARGIEAVKGKHWEKEGKIIGGVPHFVGDIFIDSNTFIGARAMILPNTHIGKNCIIGAGAVVKGIVPDDSIVVGNPGKIIANTRDWTEKHIEKKDFINCQF